jgi:Cys-rich protein (TIGR01571 family)
VAAVRGHSLKLDVAGVRSKHHLRHIDGPIEQTADTIEAAAEAVEGAMKPSKEVRNQWKDGVKDAKDNAESDNADIEDVPGGESQVKDMKKPWKMPKDQRKFWEDTRDGKGEAMEQWKDAIASALVWFVLVALFGHYYHGHYASRDLKPESILSSQDWSTGIFDVKLLQPSLCCMSCCCPAVRWSQTVAMTRLMGFWTAFLCFNVANLFTAIPLFGTPFAAALDTYDRIQMREILGMPEATRFMIMRDCCLFMCCSSCMIAQEAYHVEELVSKGL